MRLKNTADNFSASFHITPPYQMMVIHSSKLIYPRELYQRGMEIYRSGMDNTAKLPGWKKYVFPIYMAYNGKCRKDALPIKF